MKKCPVCSSNMLVKFFDGGVKPLATLGWPSTNAQAINMEKYPLDYVQCMRCSHIWNFQFDYTVVPYEDNPNRMFNTGTLWQSYIKKTLNQLNEHLPQNPTVIDIGCGEGHFVRDLAKVNESSGRFLGFDPNTSGESGTGIEFIPRYFEPETDTKQYEPDLLIMRHVLEHLEDPAEFLEQLAVASLRLDKPMYFFAEAPCVDLAVRSGRIVDFFYEHPSQFTKKSFTKLMQLGGEVKWVNTDYGDEVVNGLVRLSVDCGAVDQGRNTQKFSKLTLESKVTIMGELNSLSSSEETLVIWGGTGKGATFMQHYQLDRNRFPYVVDSDIEKVGTFVPGMGQEIRHSSELKAIPADIIIIPTQWRAADIYGEIKSRNISYKKIVLEHNGSLLDFETDQHPYKL